jgi:hypothetical protein
MSVRNMQRKRARYREGGYTGLFAEAPRMVALHQLESGSR